MYDEQRVALLLAAYWNGGEQVAGAEAVPPGMRTADHNPAHGNTHLAEMVDLRRAIKFITFPEMTWVLLEMRCGIGMSFDDIAGRTQLSPDRVADETDGALRLLTYAMNNGWGKKRGESERV